VVEVFEKSFWKASKEIEFIDSGGWCHDNTRINSLPLSTSSWPKVVQFVEAVQQMVAQIFRVPQFYGNIISVICHKQSLVQILYYIT
jgi:hypothetical protein